MRIRSIALMLGSTALATSLIAAPTLAADYPVLRGSQVEDAPPPPDRFTWDGFYVGGGGGVSDTKFRQTALFPSAAVFAFNNTTLGRQAAINVLPNNIVEKGDSGATYFGFMGYNAAFGDAVLGVEADYTRSGHSFQRANYVQSGSTTVNGFPQDYDLWTRQSAKLDDYATLRLRMGWAFGSFMPFATIGGAVGRFNTLSRVYAVDSATQADLTPASAALIRKNTYSFGLSAGGGVDWALGDNMFLRGEYQLIRFADVDGLTTTVNTARAALGVKF